MSKSPTTVFFLLLIALTSPIFTQKLPDKIRGYKVHNARVVVDGNVAPKSNTSAIADATVTITNVGLAKVGLTGLTLSVDADIVDIGRSGKIDFATFEDIRVNGIKVNVEEYSSSFDLTKGKSTKLPVPALIFIGPGSLAKAAYKEIFESKKVWSISGTVYVFGRFKKFGFTFKRVVPVPIKINIQNPIRN